ncbi:unnamed protein product [Brachionus calyciflorus]|uniref:MULE transposase domain-containing protein n=1 Tax=Brachionus calyciflorus TaxID=104777 RepID=A0A814CS81_9BILA|nr:unnamed protein product [Brachionus calyciflorus]
MPSYLPKIKKTEFEVNKIVDKLCSQSKIEDYQVNENYINIFEFDENDLEEPKENKVTKQLLKKENRPNFDPLVFQLNTFKCKSRGISGLKPPLTVTQDHTKHKAEPAKCEVLEFENECKRQAKETNEFPRTKNRKNQIGLSNECINTGPNDKNRIIIFTTEDNLCLMAKYTDWYCDGTFDISPTLFKQVYSLHVPIKDHVMPMLYGFLPNKKQLTYKKFFKKVKELGNVVPNSINLDFELAAINAAKQK